MQAGLPLKGKKLALNKNGKIKITQTVGIRAIILQPTEQCYKSDGFQRMCM